MSSSFIHVAGVRIVLLLRLHNIPRCGCAVFRLCIHLSLDTGVSRHVAVVDTAAVKVGVQLSLSLSLATFGMLGKGPFPAFRMSSSHVSFLNCNPLVLQKGVDRSLFMAGPTIIIRPLGPPCVPSISIVFLFYSTAGTFLEAQQRRKVLILRGTLMKG